MSALMVDVRGLDVTFGSTQVLHGVDLAVERGRTVGIGGESGSGKSTRAKVLVGEVRPSGGQAVVNGSDRAGARATLRHRRKTQMIPQEP